MEIEVGHLPKHSNPRPLPCQDTPNQYLQRTTLDICTHAINKDKLVAQKQVMEAMLKLRGQLRGTRYLALLGDR